METLSRQEYHVSASTNTLCGARPLFFLSSRKTKKLRTRYQASKLKADNHGTPWPPGATVERALATGNLTDCANKLLAELMLHRRLVSWFLKSAQDDRVELCTRSRSSIMLLVDTCVPVASPKPHLVHASLLWREESLL